MSQDNKHLYNLNELSDYKISDGYPDIRGWDVKDYDNRVIGKVDNLLVNKDAERVVYLDVEVDKTIIDAKHDPYGRPTHGDIREFVNKDGENHIIVPIGLVDLNQDSNYVYTDIIDHGTFSETKRFRKGDNVSRDYEVQVLDSYNRRAHPQNRHNDNVVENDNFLEREKMTNEIPSESRIREIVREEIRQYHNNNDNDNFERSRYTDSVADDVFLTDEERELNRRRRNDDVNDDDRFYERREFDDKRFRNRTPGL